MTYIERGEECKKLLLFINKKNIVNEFIQSGGFGKSSIFKRLPKDITIMIEQYFISPVYAFGGFSARLVRVFSEFLFDAAIYCVHVFLV